MGTILNVNKNRTSGVTSGAAKSGAAKSGTADPENIDSAPHPARDHNKKGLFIKTYGCQMNVYDSERMADVLSPLGYGLVERAEDANMVILNTCHIREKAAEKVYSELGRMRQMKEARALKGDDDITIAVAGCVAQAEGAEITRRAPIVDMVLGPQSYHKLPEMIARTARNQGEILETDFDTLEKFDELPIERDVKGFAAFVTIQEGCDKFCTFCVVPYTRGAEVSRPVDQIITEIRALAARGVREITLLGQNVNAYHGDAPALDKTGAKSWTLGQLIRHIDKIGGIERIRFTTSHPRDMDEDLIAAHGEVKKLMPYLHLPLQAGSDKILKAMNRGHTFGQYKDLIARIRAAQPDLALSSDFIVGFPGETEEDFEATLQAVREIGYGSAFSFKYSVRPGTPGAELAGQVPEDVKSERLARLQELLTAQQTDFNKSLIGKTLPVLVENVSARNDGTVFGRAPYLQGTHFSAGPETVGQIVQVLITGAGRNSLTGELA